MSATTYAHILTRDHGYVCSQCGGFVRRDAQICKHCRTPFEPAAPTAPLSIGAWITQPFGKVVLFCVTLLIAVLVTLVISDAALIRAMFFFYFPEGFFNFFNIQLPRIGLLVGWLLYVGIGVAATLIKNRVVFVCLYIIFVMLLIANVAGCQAYEFGTPLL